MDKKEAKKQYQLSLLRDPKVKEWEKKKIRERYGVLVELEDIFFSNEMDRKGYKRLVNFIDSRLSIIKLKKISYAIPASILTVRTMWGFSSYFENDGFWVYSDKELASRKQKPDFTQDREDLLNALKTLGLLKQAEQLEDVWKNHYHQEHKLAELQDEFWNFKFKSSVQELIFLLVRKSEDDFRNLDVITRESNK